MSQPLICQLPSLNQILVTLQLSHAHRVDVLPMIDIDVVKGVEEEHWGLEIVIKSEGYLAVCPVA